MAARRVSPKPRANELSQNPRSSKLSAELRLLAARRIGVSGVFGSMTGAEQPVYYSDRIDPVHRSSPDQLFFLIIEARPEPDSDEYGDAGGAFVSCFVDADDLRTAERQAVALIEQTGWRPCRFVEWKFVTSASFADHKTTDDEPDPRQMVEQTFIDGTVCVFQTWPVDAPDASEASE
jgi:hypothetical protein